MQRLLRVLGSVLVVLSLAWLWLSKFGWGRLPGNINIVREDFSFHFPLTALLIISIVVSILIWLFRR